MSREKVSIQSFAEFWPFYLGEHAKPATRAFHFAGSTTALLVAIAAIAAAEPWWIPLAFVPGYGLAWFSHFFIERNMPASFKYPLWSFAADWKMWAMMLAGRARELAELAER